MTTRTLAVAALSALSSTFAVHASNLALGAPVTLHGIYGVGGWGAGVLAPGSTLTDDTLLPASTQWDQGTVWWDERESVSVGNTIEIALGSLFLIDRLVVQADDNDTYLVEYDDSGTWKPAWIVPAVGGWGMQTRDSGHLATPFTTDALRFSALGGDLYYSVSEIQAYTQPVPEASTVFAGGALLGMASLIYLRRRRSAC